MITSMSLYKRGRRWWVKFRDHKRIPRRIRGGSREGAVALERTLTRLVDAVGTNKPVPDDIAVWINEKLDTPRRERLMAWGLIDSRRLLAGIPLPQHLEDWCEYLRRGNTDKHADKSHNRARQVIEVMEVEAFSEITGERISRAIVNLGRSQSTSNGYLTSIKQFCKWMVDHDRAGSPPPGIGLLKRQQVTQPVVARRSLTDAEITKLMRAPAARRIVYLVALQTGLRANEIRTLDRQAFDLDGAVFTVRAANTKAKKDVTLPIEPGLLDELRRCLKKSPRSGPVFHVPYRTARMIQKDLGTKDVDFHCLRHTFGTRLARAGVHPRTAQRLMRHSTIELTLRHYTHLQFSDDVQAVAKLGGLCPPVCPTKAKIA
jgi:integrase